jgi:hypothetical protein
MLRFLPGSSRFLPRWGGLLSGPNGFGLAAFLLAAGIDTLVGGPAEDGCEGHSLLGADKIMDVSEGEAVTRKQVLTSKLPAKVFRCPQ